MKKYVYHYGNYYESNNEKLLDLVFDQFERYSITAEIINLFKQFRDVSKFKILDVGGFSRRIDYSPILPIAEFLPQDDTITYDLYDHDSPKYKKGDKKSWAFKKEEFDIITSCDTLEHIEPSLREVFLNRLLKTSK